MPQQQKQRAKGRKIGRNKRHQAAAYRSADRHAKNAKRRLRRHLRRHPGDQQNRFAYLAAFGEPDLGLASKGRKRTKRLDDAAARSGG